MARAQPVTSLRASAAAPAGNETPEDRQRPAGRFRFRSLGADQGLENSVVFTILQDDAGFLWVGTDDGLHRYDGSRFQRFQTSDGLPASTVTTLAGGRDGVPLWVGTGLGLARWDGSRARAMGTDQGMPATFISGLALSAGKLWVATASGLFRQVGDDRFELARGWPGGGANAVWADADGTLFAAQGADLLSSSPGRGWVRLGSSMGLGSERIDAVVRDATGTLWARGRKKLWSRGPDQSRFVEERLPFALYGEEGHLSLDRRGSLWVPAESFALHREGARWVVLGPREGLPQGSLRSVFQDREGSLWFAATGLHQQLGKGLWRLFSRREGLPGDVVWTEWRDPRGFLWVGTDRGLAQGEPDGRAWRLVPGTANNAIRTVASGPDGALWMGGAPAELLRLDVETQEVQRFDAQDGVLGSKVLVARFDRAGTLWVGTDGGGLLRRGADVGGRPHFEPVQLPGGSPTERVSSIQEDASGRLWVAAERGLAVRDNGSWHRFGTADGFRARWLAYVVVRRSGEICASYAETLGVACFRYGLGRVDGLHHLDSSQGLVNAKIYMLGEDAAGRLWVGTGKGVDIVTNQGVHHFSEQQGLPGDDAAAMSFLAEPDGVWFGTSTGLGWFDSSRYDPGTAPLRPAFVQILLGEHRFVPGEPAPSVTRAERTFEARYASLSYLDISHVTYAVQLLPEEAAPRETSSQEARYTNLGPGKHEFLLRARLPPGEYSEPIRFAFEILPAWWQTVWARLAGALVLIGIAAVALSWRVRALGARRASEALARSEEGFRKLIEASPDAILVHRNGLLVYVNPAAVAALGWSRSDELVGVPMLSLFHADDRAAVSSRMLQVGPHSEPLPLREERLLRKDGAVRTFEIAALFAEFAGEPCVLAVARDVSERKQLEARLLLSDRMASVGTLASGVAHEINNPLAYLQANLDWSLDTLAASPQGLPPGQVEALAEALREALDGADRVRKIVGGLRTFARSPKEAGLDVSLAEVLESALKLVANEVRHKARVVRTFDPAPLVHVDPARLAQVFVNLILNAAQAIPEGRADENTIRLITRTDGSGRAVAEVEDTGPGIPQEVVGRVFDPFFTTKAVGGGTGLGLSICHGIVAAVGGEISVTSTPGAGATFKVTLPPAPARPADPPRRLPTKSQPPVRRGSVWVVDDEALVGTAIRRALAAEHDVQIFAQAHEVLARIERGEKFDLLLCDLMMPRCSGPELHARIAAVAPDLAARMSFMTGGAFTADAQAFLASLGRAPLEKPFRADDLRALVTRVLRAA